MSYKNNEGTINTYDELTDEVGVQTLAAANGLDRRKNVRIKFCPVEPCPLPKVHLQGAKLSPIDISFGGMALRANETTIHPDVGDEFSLQLIWEHLDIYVRACVVGLSSGRIHLRWSDLVNEKLQKELTPLVQVAILGSRMSPVYSQLQNVNLLVDELYLGATGECLTFYQTSHKSNEDVYLRWGSTEFKIRWNPFQIESEGRTLNSKMLAQCIVLLSQQSITSPRLRELLVGLSMKYQSCLKDERVND